MRLQALHNLLGVRQLGLVGGVYHQYDTLQATGSVGYRQQLSPRCPVQGPSYRILVSAFALQQLQC